MLKNFVKFSLFVLFFDIALSFEITSKSKSRADAAIELIKSWPNCGQIFQNPLDFDQCSAAQLKENHQIRVFSAINDQKSSSFAEFELIFPDQRISSGSSKSYVVVDPFPELAFGHLVFVFSADPVGNTAACKPHGVIVNEGSTKTCLRLVFKRCKDSTTSNCGTDFLSLVVEIKNEISPVNAGQRDLANEQALSCRNLPGFMACPATDDHQNSAGLENLGDKSRIFGRSCEPQETDGQCKNRLEFQISHSISCKWLIKCDQAAIVSGFWNQGLGAHMEGERTVKRMRDDLVNRYLFDVDNVTIFYGHGLIHISDLPVNKVYPAKFKNVIRSYFQKMCSMEFCIGTFAVFFNGLATQNGSLLLWDTNRNGFADDKEIYTPKEIFDDLSNCKASRVLIVADYSYSSHLAEYFEKNSPKKVSSEKINKNRVIILTTGPMPPYRQQLTNLWFNSDTFRACFDHANSPDFYKVPFESYGVINFDGPNGTARTAISGERCTFDEDDGPAEPKKSGCRQVGFTEFHIKSQRTKRTYALENDLFPNETMS